MNNLGKPKMYVKEETVKRLHTLLKKYKTKEVLLTSKEYQSLCDHYINGFEREHLDTIVDLCCNGKTYDEIRFIINGGNTNMSKKPSTKSKTTTEDPVEESVFLVGEQRVVETEPVTITIGADDIIPPEAAKKNKIKNSSRSSKSNDAVIPVNGTIIDNDEEDNSEPVILSNLGKTNKSKSDDEGIISKSFGSFMKAYTDVVNNAIKKADEFIDELEAEDRKLAVERRKRENAMVNA